MNHNFNNLSPSSIINGLYYLSFTDPNSWDQQQLILGKQVISNVEALKPGNQTREALNSFKAKLQKVELNLQH